jgi:L-lactate dehydrogenase
MKIGIVGSGMVGATSAYAMLMKGIGREIILVDKDKERAAAEAEDILHAAPFSNPLSIRSGNYEDLEGSRLVVISAGVSQKEGESRLDLLKRNAQVFREIVPNILNYAKDSVVVVATNPVDIMTHLAAKFAGEMDIDSSRIIGSGTTLDTARYRSILAARLGIDPQHVHGYVLGEHGDSEMIAWSVTTISALSLNEFCERRGVAFDAEFRTGIEEEVRNSAYRIIKGKGATYYGIGAAVAKIADVVTHDQRSLLSVTTPTESIFGVENVSISLPRLVGGRGILDTIHLNLDSSERDKLNKSASVVKNACVELDSA